MTPAPSEAVRFRFTDAGLCSTGVNLGSQSWKDNRCGASFTSVAQLGEHIDAFIDAYNENARPFVWTKPAGSIGATAHVKGREISVNCDSGTSGADTNFGSHVGVSRVEVISNSGGDLFRPRQHAASDAFCPAVDS
ncbi:MAG: hypothetical protein R3D52_11375 [Xanthobacteraceae bacterium]